MHPFVYRMCSVCVEQYIKMTFRGSMDTIGDNKKNCHIFFSKSDNVYLSMDVLQLYVASSKLKKTATMKGYGDTNCSRSIYTGTNMQGVKII